MPNANRAMPLQTLQNAVAVAANGASLDLSDAEAVGVMIEISGTFTGITANFEASIDGGTTYFGVSLAQLSSTSRARVAAATATGLYLLEQATGVTHVRARTTVATPTGSMTVKGRVAVVQA